MAIDDEHPDYMAHKEQWQKCRDCAAGQEVVHAAGEKYLPKLSDQTPADYKAYKNRALFYGAFARTVDALSGMVFRRAPDLNAPDALLPMLDDVTLGGMNLQGFAEQIVDDDITIGRAGILVDHPVAAIGTTLADAEALNLRPFLKYYSAENIFNWKTEGRNNEQVLTQVRLWEMQELPGENEFDTTTRLQIRVLDLDDAGNYRQRIFIKLKMPLGNQVWIQLGDDIIPLMNGAPLTEIPFFFVGVKNADPCPVKPPLIELANANLSHYVSTADLEHGAHFTGLPTAVITGHTSDAGTGEDAETFRIGASTAWVFSEENAKAFYLEFQGQGLTALENRIAKKEEYMAYLGARMLAPEKAGVEATQTVQLKQYAETSVLSSLAQSASQAIEAALNLMCEWAGLGDDAVTFKLNKEFLALSMDAPTLMALLQMWQGGGIAYADLLDNLKRGEVVAEDRTEDDIRSEIETSSPFNGMDMPPPPAPYNGGGA